MNEISATPWMVNGRQIRDAAGRQIGTACEWDTRAKPDVESWRQRSIVANNARLMAAAPRMLELLERAQSYIDSSDGPSPSISNDIATLRAEIEGR